MPVQDLERIVHGIGAHMLVECAVIDKKVGAAGDERLQSGCNPLHIATEEILVEDAALNSVLLHEAQRGGRIHLVYPSLELRLRWEEVNEPAHNTGQDHGVKPRPVCLRL